MDNLEWAHLPGTLRYGRKGLWRWSVFLCGSSVKGTWREGSLAGNPEGYVGKALEMGISFHRCPRLGNLEERLSNGDFERWMKGFLGVVRLSLKRLRGAGLVRGAPSLGSLEDVKKVSGCGQLSPWGPLST